MSPARRDTIKTILYSAILLLGAIGVFAWLLSSRSSAPMQQPEAPGRPVEIQVAAWGGVPTEIRALGRLRSASAVDIVARVGGEILWTAGDHGVKPGLRLARGERLCLIDTTDAALELRRLEAQLALAVEQHAIAVETLDLQRRELDRLERLREADNASDSAVESVRRAWLSQLEKEASLRSQTGPAGSLTAQRDAARVKLERCDVRAPHDLEVVDGDLVPGALAAAGQRLASVIGLETLELPVSLRAVEAHWLPDPARRAVDVELRSAGGEDGRWTGRLIQLSRSVDATTQTREALVSVPGGQPGLLPGQMVEAVFPGRTVERGLAIPRRALRADGKVLVWRDGRLAIEAVEVAYSDRERAVLGDGPAEGDTLVTSPIPDAVAGMRLALRGAPATAESAPVAGSGPGAGSGTGGGR